LRCAPPCHQASQRRSPPPSPLGPINR
jgi:hypothetical protein